MRRKFSSLELLAMQEEIDQNPPLSAKWMDLFIANQTFWMKTECKPESFNDLLMILKTEIHDIDNDDEDIIMKSKEAMRNLKKQFGGKT